MCAHSKTHAQATEVRKQIMKKETVSQKKPAGSPGRTRFGKTAKKNRIKSGVALAGGACGAFFFSKRRARAKGSEGEKNRARIRQAGQSGQGRQPIHRNERESGNTTHPMRARGEPGEKTR